MHWHHAELTGCYHHPRVAMLEALVIIEAEWHPPPCALRELTTARTEEATAHFWH